MVRGRVLVGLELLVMMELETGVKEELLRRPSNMKFELLGSWAGAGAEMVLLAAEVESNPP